MTRKGEYAVCHIIRAGNDEWSCVLPTTHKRDGHVEYFLEAPGSLSKTKWFQGIEFFEIPNHPLAQGLAERLFNSLATFSTASDLQKAMMTDIPSIRRFI